MGAYGRSKLCNVLFTRELARRLRVEGSRVTVNAVHPGFVATGLGDDDPGLINRLFGFAKRFALSPEKGAETSLYVATSAEGGEVTGQYFDKCRIVSPSATAQDAALAERLWAASEALAAGAAR
jgi:NAD(P)-dependent dehydrogenase (short-subunit alcohol dehydrogenase family)